MIDQYYMSNWYLQQYIKYQLCLWYLSDLRSTNWEMIKLASLWGANQPGQKQNFLALFGTLLLNIYVTNELQAESIYTIEIHMKIFIQPLKANWAGHLECRLWIPLVALLWTSSMKSFRLIIISQRLQWNLSIIC